MELAAEDSDIITLPLNYNKAVQGMIYHKIGEHLPEIHDRGYMIGSRVFRLFVFSRIQGKMKEIRDGRITFWAPIRIQVSSPIEQFLELLANRLLHTSRVNLASYKLSVNSVSIRKNPDFSSGEARVRAISPITVYSTLLTADGRKKTYYYHPKEKEFSEQIRNNLFKKAVLLCNDASSNSFSIVPQRVKNTDQKIVYYKDFIVRGWLGKYLMKGTPQLLDIAYDTGLGSKNAQGFGMIEIIPE